MKYIVSARDWTNKLKEQFGEERSIVELTDTEIVQAILDHGRAEIWEDPNDGGTFELHFSNDYD